jgi:hypothetical protein
LFKALSETSAVVNISSPHTFRGVEFEVTQSSHGFSLGDVIRYGSSGWTKAQANSIANARADGVVVEVVSTSVFKYVIVGQLTGVSGLTAGSQYFLSSATAGALTSTEPEISVPIYKAISTTAATVNVGHPVYAPREIDVCHSGTAKKMLVQASGLYT